MYRLGKIIQFDPRGYCERRVVELQLGMVFGRSFQQMDTPTNRQLVDHARDLDTRLPWEARDVD